MRAGNSTTARNSDLESHAHRLRDRLCAIFLIGLPAMVAPAAIALPLTPFRLEAQAQRHCPGDMVVWLDFRKEIYYVKRQKQYGQGPMGSFVCEKEARASRFRRSLLGMR